jgi:hypothetical protein
VEDLDVSFSTFGEVQPVSNPLAFVFIYLVYLLLKQSYMDFYDVWLIFIYLFILCLAMNLLTCLMFPSPPCK